MLRNPNLQGMCSFLGSYMYYLIINFYNFIYNVVLESVVIAFDVIEEACFKVDYAVLIGETSTYVEI